MATTAGLSCRVAYQQETCLNRLAALWPLATVVDDVGGSRFLVLGPSAPAESVDAEDASVSQGSMLVEATIPYSRFSIGGTFYYIVSSSCSVHAPNGKKAVRCCAEA